MRRDLGVSWYIFRPGPWSKGLIFSISNVGIKFLDCLFRYGSFLFSGLCAFEISWYYLLLSPIASVVIAVGAGGLSYAVFRATYLQDKLIIARVISLTRVAVTIGIPAVVGFAIVHVLFPGSAQSAWPKWVLGPLIGSAVGFVTYTNVKETSVSMDACPRCNSPLTLKRNRKTLEKFYGCSKYPVCRYTRNP
jgi:hypothetical protein